MRENIVCNLLYNNGDEDDFVGFKGRCDVPNIIYNVEKGKGRWCSQPECSCKSYYDAKFNEPIEDEFPCSESKLFVNWDWTPGHKFKTGEPFKIRKTGKNKLAILTTVFKGDEESSRKIIGFFKIKEVTENSHKIVAYKEQSIRLNIDEGKELNFWEYYKNKKGGKPDWRQGRFRYLNDKRAAVILHDLISISQNESDISLIKKILHEDFSEYSITRPNIEGALLSRNVKKETLLKRKYGRGGESKAHKDLKLYVAQNPEFIGLKKDDLISYIEHKFISGDLVDILFESKKELTDTVIEIELDNVLPGIHQAIKYRVLRCSQRGLLLDSEKVKAVVVAWDFTKNEEELCEKYKIEHYKKKL